MGIKLRPWNIFIMLFIDYIIELNLYGIYTSILKTNVSYLMNIFLRLLLKQNVFFWSLEKYFPCSLKQFWLLFKTIRNWIDIPGTIGSLDLCSKFGASTE